MYHTSLDFLWEAYVQYKLAVSEYERLRAEYFSELRDKVYSLIETPRNSDESALMPLWVRQTQSWLTWRWKEIPVESLELNWIEVSWWLITSRNSITIEWYDGNQYVSQDFFWDKVKWNYFSTHSGEKLKIQFDREKADIIEEARYKWVRYREDLLFQALFDSLWKNFRAIFLYSASWIQDINCSALELSDSPVEKKGNWDYIDDAFINPRRSSVYNAWVLETLKGFGIENPRCINPNDDCFTSWANNVDAWKYATLWNKSTRIVSWFVWGKNWPPKEVKYGNYGVAYAESCQAGDGTTIDELYKLAKDGWYIILPVWMLEECSKFWGKIQILLDNPEWDFGLVQKRA